VKLFIKNMVSTRCKMLVRKELEKLGIRASDIQLGEVEIHGEMTKLQNELFRHAISEQGLELMDDRILQLIEKIKAIIIESVHYADEPLTVKFSTYLSEKTHHDYSYLSNLFSHVQGITLEKYVICHRIERVKELLLYDDLTLTQIANQMNYSSVSHLSTQFKRITGFTPSHFKGSLETKKGIK